jgi:ribosomal-protein-alanine N-acetyltransferase
MNIECRLSSVGDAEALAGFYRENAEHLREWQPLRGRDCDSVESWRERLAVRDSEHSAGVAAHFVACLPAQQQVIATCSLTNIVLGPFQACNMGYAVSRSFEGQGHMKKLCRYAIGYAFDELGLNRVMANYMPRNQRSAALLNSLGFTREGLARKYLQINGKWEDHVLTALLNPRNG